MKTVANQIGFVFFFLCVFLSRRTKWKRQTAVGLELLAEAGNYAAFQRLYGGPPYGCWPYPAGAAAAAAAAGGGAGSVSSSGGAPSAADLYYRQAAVAAAAVSTLQKPLAYRLYPGMAGGPGTAGAGASGHHHHHIPPPPPPLAHPLYYGGVHHPAVMPPMPSGGRSPTPEPPRSSRGSPRSTVDSRPGSVDVEDDGSDSPNLDV